MNNLLLDFPRKTIMLKPILTTVKIMDSMKTMIWTRDRYIKSK